MFEKNYLNLLTSLSTFNIKDDFNNLEMTEIIVIQFI